MRILLVTGSYPPMRCGVGDYCQNLAQALADSHAIQVGVLTSVSVGITGGNAGLEIFPVMEMWGLSEAFRVIKKIKNWSPDVVHIQYPTQGYKNGFLPLIIPIISFFMRKKVVQTWHEGYSRRYVASLFLKSLIPCGLIFVRPNYKANLHLHLRWALWKKITIFIPNASAIPKVFIDNEKKDVLKRKYLKNQNRLIVFFGFVYPHKGVELLFDIADSAHDTIVIAGAVDEKSEYFRELVARASTTAWLNKVVITGYISAIDIAELLSVADAVILPFRVGGGEWNTSIHGAVQNDAFVITTSLTHDGYDMKNNIYFSKIDDVEEMKSALNKYAGKRRVHDLYIDNGEWLEIAKKHISFYKNLF